MTALNVKLLLWQQEVWQHPAKYKIVAAGRRCGKTEKAAWRLIVNALSDGKDGARFYVAPTQGQARDAMWKKLLSLGAPVIKSTHINNLEVNLVNGQTISLKGADRPETMRGVRLADLVVDEYANMKSYVLEEILMPAMTDLDSPMLLIGSPSGRNHFYDLYTDVVTGVKGPEWAAFHFTSYDNPVLKREVIDRFKEQMSSYAFRQEFMASFEAQGSEIFKEDWIKYGDTPKDCDYYIAIDLAGFQEVGKVKSKNTKLDQSAIAVVGVTPDGSWHIENIIRGRWEFAQTAEKIFQAVRDYRPVAVGIEKGISRQAIMSPLSDLMRRYNSFFNVKELTHGNKKKTDRIVAALQGRFEHGRITLAKGDWNEEFLDQLFQFPNALVHDDLVDALAYIDQLTMIPYGIEDFVETNYVPLDILSGY